MYWLAWENSWRFATPPRFQPVRSTFQIWVVTRHQTVWNFCACASDVTWWGNQLWRREMTAVFSGYVSVRLRVVPHFSSGIVERVKRERAWKSPHARKGDTRRGERKILPTACRLFSRGVIFTRARVSLPLLSLRKNGGLLVVCVSVSHLIFIGVRRQLKFGSVTLFYIDTWLSLHNLLSPGVSVSWELVSILCLAL